MLPGDLRPVRRWVRVWAIVTVVLAFILLGLGGFVTSFRVGMADPVWPTTPWFLFNNTKWEFGFVVEHTHRLAGWIVGIFVSVLAIAVWWTEPNRRLQLGGLAAILFLLAIYGEFHRGMGKVWNELKATAARDFSLDPRAANFEAMLAESRAVERVRNWPVTSGSITLLAALSVVGCGLAAGLSGASGGWLRAWALIGLVAIMIQGLLGGFRVFFNALAGSNLAAIHGAFGQLAVCLLVVVAVLCEPRRAGDALPDADREPISRLAWVLVLVLGLQLIWAVLLRHSGSEWSQRLHILTAFVVVALVVWIVVVIHLRPAATELLSRTSYHIVAILALQLAFGLEAWLGKFAASGPQAQIPPAFRPVTSRQATTRTLHQIIGCGLLASATALALRASRRPESLSYEETLFEGDVPPVAAMAFQHDEGGATDSKAPDVATMALIPPDGGLLR